MRAYLPHGEATSQPVPSAIRTDECGSLVHEFPEITDCPAFAIPLSAPHTSALTAEAIDDEAECILRDLFMLAHRDVLQPETRRELLRLFYVVLGLPQ